jgi:hypothetical protein
VPLKPKVGKLRRVKNSSPALAVAEQERVVRQRYGDADDAILQTLPGWDTFSPIHKRFLAVLPYFNSRPLAAQYILGGVSNKKAADWVNNHCRQHMHLRDACRMRESRKDHMVETVRGYFADMLGKAFLKMDMMMDDDGDRKSQLETIKLILRTLGLTTPEGAPTTNVKVQLNEITMFRPKEPVLVESMVVEG